MFEPTWFFPLYGIVACASVLTMVVAFVQAVFRSRADHLKWLGKPMTLPEKVGASIVTLCFFMTLYNNVPLWWPWMMARAPWSWVIALVLGVFLGYSVLKND